MREFYKQLGKADETRLKADLALFENDLGIYKVEDNHVLRVFQCH